MLNEHLAHAVKYDWDDEEEWKSAIPEEDLAELAQLIANDAVELSREIKNDEIHEIEDNKIYNLEKPGYKIPVAEIKPGSNGYLAHINVKLNRRAFYHFDQEYRDEDISVIPDYDEKIKEKRK